MGRPQYNFSIRQQKPIYSILEKVLASRVSRERSTTCSKNRSVKNPGTEESCPAIRLSPKNAAAAPVSVRITGFMRAMAEYFNCGNVMYGIAACFLYESLVRRRAVCKANCPLLLLYHFYRNCAIKYFQIHMAPFAYYMRVICEEEIGE